jgi:predicted deacylase
MTRAPSRLSADIDFDKEGKQTGFVRLPHSVHRSAYGWIPIPVACIRNGEGPRVLLTSGNHGDEYEGQVTLMKLVRELQAKDVRGRIIVLSAANFPAAMAGLRTSPIDDGNLNRSFPGDPNGTVTEQIAYYIETVLLAQSDFACDMHSGGSSLMYIPSALARRFDDKAKTQQSVDLLRAFGAPVGYLTDAPQGADRTLTAGGERQGVRTMGTELGGSGTVTPAALRVGESGLRRVLGLVGALTNPPKEKPPETRLMEVRGWDYYVYAPDSGLWEPLVELGDEVEAGQPAAAIHFPDTPWREPTIARFERAGTVICKRIPGRTERGDCLFHLGTAVKV